MELTLIIFAVVLGALIGSFTNVLIYRIPRGESVAFPPSHCPKCDHKLGVLDLAPVFSWLFLRGKCHYCSNPISSRYPIVEVISAVGYGAIAWQFPLLDYGLGTLSLWFFFTVLLAGSGIDLDTKILPDVLTLLPFAIGLAFAYFGGTKPGLPDFNGALQGALVGTGLLALIAGLGAWMIRKFAETKFPEFPIDYMHIHLGAFIGAWFGWPWAVAGVAVMVVANYALKKLIRIPDWFSFGGLILSLILAAGGFGRTILTMTAGALTGAGVIAIIAGTYWAVFFAIHKEDLNAAESDNFDPVAMGFGDVKLAAVIGAFLGWQGALMAFSVAVLLGAILGVIGRFIGGDREIPFGPYLAVGALVALFTRSEPLITYLHTIGF